MSDHPPPPESEEDDRQPFLQRWSRLKSTARAGEPAAAETPAGGAPGPGSEEAAGTRPPLPDIDQLDQDSDYSAFLAPEVDPLLRRLALRKLFRSPKFNVCDGLDDYCDDFTCFAPLGSTVTADMRHQLERAARQALASAEKAATADSQPDVPDRDEFVAAAAESAGGGETTDAAPGGAGLEDADTGPA